MFLYSTYHHLQHKPQLARNERQLVWYCCNSLLTELLWNLNREMAQERSCELKATKDIKGLANGEPGTARSYFQKAKEEPSLGNIRYLWHWRLVQVQLKSLYNISEIFSMKTDHIFGYTRLVTPRKRWESQEFLKSLDHRGSQNCPAWIHWTNHLLQSDTVHKASPLLSSILLWEGGVNQTIFSF